MKKYLLSIIFSLLILSSCNNNKDNESENISTETNMVNSSQSENVTDDISEWNSDIKEISELYADYVVFDGIIYSSIQNDSQWVSYEYEYVKGDIFGEVLYNSDEKILNKLKDNTSNILPIGTILYNFPENPIIILAEFYNELIPYLKIVEG